MTDPTVGDREIRDRLSTLVQADSNFNSLSHDGGYQIYMKEMNQKFYPCMVMMGGDYRNIEDEEGIGYDVIEWTHKIVFLTRVIKENTHAVPAQTMTLSDFTRNFRKLINTYQTLNSLTSILYTDIGTERSVYDRQDYTIDGVEIELRTKQEVIR